MSVIFIKRFLSMAVAVSCFCHADAQYTDTLSKYILTPKESPAPKINGPKVFGVRPAHPILFTIPATGTRPMTFSADNLPKGVEVDAKTGRLSGVIEKNGEYTITIHAK